MATFPVSSEPQQLLALAREDLACYAIAQHPPFEFARHLQVVTGLLERIERGDLNRLILSMPPRHGKSLLSSTLFPAWYLGRNPGRQVITASYGQDLAEDFGRRVRNLVASPLHVTIFPECRLSENSAAAHRLFTTAGGVYVAVGRGGAITGRGADLLLIDDPLKDREEANSESVRKGLHDWFSDVAYTRLMPGGAVVIVSTRWHQDDLAGWLLREHADDGWVELSFPAIAERDEEFRREGEALWPERFPIADLERMRAQIGGAAWASLYQQRPAASEGAIFRRAWWQDYRDRPRLRRIVQSWDTAFKKGSENDFSVCTTWGEGESGYYLLHLWRARVEFPELKRKVAEFAKEYRPHAILIEDRASGQSLIQEVKHGSRLPILPVKADSDKLTRAQAVTPLIEAGKVFLPERAPWREEFLDEVSTFPAAAHDDITDSTVQALNYLRQNPYRGSTFAFYSAYLDALEEDARRDPYREADMVELDKNYRRR